jgi:hypothetical protein
MEGGSWHIAPIAAMQKEISQAALRNFANCQPAHVASIAALVHALQA